MGAIRLNLLPTYIDKEKLKSQLDKNANVQGRLRNKVEEFLQVSDIWSLEYVNFNVLKDYREYISNDESLSPMQKRSYRSGLEQVMMPFLEEEYGTIATQIDELSLYVPIRNKLLTFLMLSDIEDASDINYEIRQSYSEYIKETVAESKYFDYLKPIDHLKLKSIKDGEVAIRNNNAPVVKYRNSKFFLLYYPSYEIANSFTYVQDKERLMFDFGLPGSELMKKQVFEMLIWVVNNKTDHKLRQELYIVPLKLFYSYCISAGIEDINEISHRDIAGYKQSIAGKVGTKEDIYCQIIGNIRKFLFLNADETPWNATEWFLERFHFTEGRMNPAREIKTISFDEIENKNNRKLLQEYMKYLIGIAQKISLQNVNLKFSAIRMFLYYCDSNGTALSTLTTTDIKDYVSELNEKDIEPEYFNRQLTDICVFINYLQGKALVPKFTFYLKYYLKKKAPKHNDRTVPAEIEIKVLKAIGKAPEHLRLMFLNVWSIGLRISEVCVIKGSSYVWDGEDAWISIYQNKMKSEKRIPIPSVIFTLMREYIEKNNIGANEYVFSNQRGGAYSAGKFSKEMKAFLEEAGIDKEYLFKAHDFRHGVATGLHDSGASLQTIRDYLGHNDENMTKQYIDFVPAKIDKATESYFDNESNDIAKKILEKRKGNKNSE